jgi:uncharacterized membrane protein YccF (DUF307 family)
MRFILNVLWIIFGGGIVICLEYLLAGLILCITIVGIPFGVQCFKLAGLGLMPFGREPVEDPSAGAVSFLLNVFWLIVAGIWIFISHVVLGVGLAVTIIGIPFAYQHLKFAALALAPFGKRVRDVV